LPSSSSSPLPLVVIVLFRGQLEDLEKTARQRHRPWHADGATILRLGVQGADGIARTT
jgi:hypothetical protein